MIVVKININDPHEPPLLLGDRWVDNGDGYHSLLMPDGQFAFHNAPGPVGSFGRSPNQRGAYQQAKLNGQLVGWHTRPEDPSNSQAM